MYICPKCSHISSEPKVFCDICGERMMLKKDEPRREEPVVHIPTPPPAPRPMYTEPAPVYREPAPIYDPITYVPGPVVVPDPPRPQSKGKAIAGGILGISGFVFGIIGLIFSFCVMGSLVDSYYGLYMMIIGGVYSFVFGLIGLPLSIVGTTLTKSAINNGTDMGIARAGKVLGIIGIVFSAIALFFGIIGISVISDY